MYICPKKTFAEFPLCCCVSCSSPMSPSNKSSLPSLAYPSLVDAYSQYLTLDLPERNPECFAEFSTHTSKCIFLLIQNACYCSNRPQCQVYWFSCRISICLLLGHQPRPQTVLVGIVPFQKVQFIHFFGPSEMYFRHHNRSVWSISHINLIISNYQRFTSHSLETSLSLFCHAWVLFKTVLCRKEISQSQRYELVKIRRLWKTEKDSLTAISKRKGKVKRKPTVKNWTDKNLKHLE